MFKKLFKKKLSPEDAGKTFLQVLMIRYQEDWENDVRAFNEINILSSIDADDGNIFREFYLASVAMELRAILNMSPALYTNVTKSIFDTLRIIEGFEDDAVNHLQHNYLARMRKVEREGLPDIEGVLEVLSESIGFSKSPITGTALLSLLSSKVGIWKTILQNTRIA